MAAMAKCRGYLSTCNRAFVTVEETDSRRTSRCDAFLDDGEGRRYRRGAASYTSGGRRNMITFLGQHQSGIDTSVGIDWAHVLCEGFFLETQYFTTTLILLAS